MTDTARAMRGMRDEEWRAPRGDGKWTRVEILGHLIDSAANNHQRFVRAIAFGDLIWPGYDQNAMVRAQHFASGDPKLLLALWESYNLHLARVIHHIPEERLTARCEIGGGAPVSFGLLVMDYVDHVQHHLRQILAD